MPIYKCPLCSESLTLEQRSYLCENKHCFDIAKEGYVNLLPVQSKKSKNPGDSKAMLVSRQQFLRQGYYDFLVRDIADLIRQHGATRGKVDLLDMGCGEGYYSEQLAEDNQQLNITAVDIAKEAARMTAKRKAANQVSVANTFDLPFFDQSFDYALSVFSPLSGKETARILKPGGVLLVVGPGENHLRGLVEHIYKQPMGHKGNPQALDDTDSLACLEQKALVDDIVVSGDHILDLLAMTPYYWQCTPEQQAALGAMAEIKTCLEFSISIYRNISPPINQTV